VENTSIVAINEPVFRRRRIECSPHLICSPLLVTGARVSQSARKPRAHCGARAAAAISLVGPVARPVRPQFFAAAMTRTVAAAGSRLARTARRRD
jgi:hypothetical protein